MHDQILSIAISVGLPIACIFLYANRIRHPLRSRLNAFLMLLGSLALIPPPAMGLGYPWYATGGDQLQALGIGGVLSVAGLLFVRSWVRSPPKVPPGTTTQLPVVEPEPEKFDEPREPGRP